MGLWVIAHYQAWVHIVRWYQDTSWIEKNHLKEKYALNVQPSEGLD